MRYKDTEQAIAAQQFTITDGSYDWTPMMHDIVGCILYHTSANAKGKDIANHEKRFGTCETNEYGTHTLKIPMRTLLGKGRASGPAAEPDTKGGSHNFDAALDAVCRLQAKPVTDRDPSSGRKNRTSMFTKAEVVDGCLVVNVTNEIWEVLTQTENITTYELNSMLTLRSRYSKRLLYMLSSMDGKPIRLSTEKIQEMFKLKETYTTSNMTRKILEPAKQELDKKCLVTFDYYAEQEKKGQGRPKTTHFTIVKKDNGENIRKTLQDEVKRKGLTSILRTETVALLMTRGYDTKEIMANLDTFATADANLDMKKTLAELDEEIADLERKGNRTNNTKGYIVTRLRSLLTPGIRHHLQKR